MPLVPSPILGGFYTAQSRLLNAQRAINLFAELVDTQDGKEPGALYGFPGLDLVAEIGPGPWRGLRVVNGTLYGVSGPTLYRITTSWTATAVGSLATSMGPIGMMNNPTQLGIVDGLQLYAYDVVSGTFATVSLPHAGDNPIVCAYQDGFGLVNESGTEQWWQSDLNDMFTWNGLNFSSADGQPDPIVGMIDLHREVWLFGTRSTEVWINAGNPGFAFQRLQGVFVEAGCAAPYSPAIAGNSVIWLGQTSYGRGIVFMSNGYQPQRISTHAIEDEIQSYGRIDDAIAYVEQMNGHVWYILTFPSADKTWMYDLSSQLWTERMWFEEGPDLYHRIRSNCFTLFNGQCITGDWENGKLYADNMNTYTDAGDTRVWLRSWPAQGTGKLTLLNTTYHRLQVYMQPGTGNALPPGDDPYLMLRWSNDGGLSFGMEHQVSIGKIGETDWRVIQRRTGSGRDRVWEIKGNTPTKVAIVGAMQMVESGIS